MKAEIHAMMQTARERKLTGWQEPTDPKELLKLAIYRRMLSTGLEKLSAGQIDASEMNEPEAITRMDLGELERFTELSARLATAWIERAEILKATVSKSDFLD